MATKEQLARVNFEELGNNPYPGRGIVMGRTVTGNLIQVYWVMGRSENSRNRILEREGDVVRTAPFDASKVKDPSLIIYNAMAHRFGQHIVSNGDQTDTAIDHLEMYGGPDGVRKGLRTRSYEPDAPNYTPRITGYTNARSQSSFFWLTRRSPNSWISDTSHIYYKDNFATQAIGRCLHTYMGDGDPLPSFERRPYLVPIGEGAEDTAQMYWDHLNSDNRVAIVAKTIRPQSDEIEYHIINALDQTGNT
jgi:IMP cyclohydrolase